MALEFLKDDADPLLTAQEVAEMLNVHVATFWAWVRAGTMPKPFKMGKFSRWPRSKILAAIEKLKAEIYEAA